MLEKQVLIVSQDIELYRSIQNNLHNSVIDICRTMSTVDILNNLLREDYNLMILDTTSLEMDSLELLYIIRKATSIPVLALVEGARSTDKVALFHAGANVCLEKAIDWSVCAAQINSLIQLYMEAQTEKCTNQPLIFGTELIIYPVYHQVIIDGEPLSLTRKEFDLLLCLARHPGQIWSRTQLYNQVWDDDLGINGENTVKTHIGNLRKKLADVGKEYIQTSWGVGYKFVLPIANEK